MVIVNLINLVFWQFCSSYNYIFNDLSSFNEVELEQLHLMYQNNKESSNQNAPGGALLRAAKSYHLAFLLLF